VLPYEAPLLAELRNIRRDLRSMKMYRHILYYQMRGLQEMAIYFRKGLDELRLISAFGDNQAGDMGASFCCR